MLAKFTLVLTKSAHKDLPDYSANPDNDGADEQQCLVYCYSSWNIQFICKFQLHCLENVMENPSYFMESETSYAIDGQRTWDGEDERSNRIIHCLVNARV